MAEVPEGRLCISRSLARTHRQSHSGLIGWSVDGTLIGDDGAIGLWYSRYVQSGPSGLFNGRKLQKKSGKTRLVKSQVKSWNKRTPHDKVTPTSQDKAEKRNDEIPGSRFPHPSAPLSSGFDWSLNSARGALSQVSKTSNKPPMFYFHSKI